MKQCYLLVLACLLSTFAVAQNIQIIPQPVEFKKTSGSFRLSAGSTIGYNKPEAKPVADMLATRISIPTGYKLKVQRSGNIQINLLAKYNPTLGEEGYTLETSAAGVKIFANKPAGLFYGAQTLLQLFPKEIESHKRVRANWSAPGVKITDYPRFGWRGLMLDVSRHFINKADVKRYIDRMAMYKYNTFHWHLTDDNGWRIEIKSLPKLTSVGACRVPRYGRFGQNDAPKPGEAATDCGFFTQDDIREIIAYASERYITIVPEIDVPGHSMAAIAAYPELACTKDTSTRVNPGSKFSEWYGGGKFKMLIDNTLNPSDENVYSFLDKVFTEVAALFPGSYIHVGGDECYKGYWENDPGCKALMAKEGMKESVQLHGYFMRRVEKIVQSKGKKMIGWDEILEGGLAPEATVMSWRGMEGGIEAAKQQHNVVMTPSSNTYIDLLQGEPSSEPEGTSYASVYLKSSYDFEPVPKEVDPKYILGGQANLWSEKIPTLRQAEYMTWPRAWALSEVYWSPAPGRNWESFVKRMEKHFDRADVAEVNYARSVYNALVRPKMENGKLMAEMVVEYPGLDLYYTLDGTFPDKFAHKYSGPVEIPEGDVMLRVIALRSGKPVGQMVSVNRKTMLDRID